jgi:Uma2 family endonuclease
MMATVSKMGPSDHGQRMSLEEFLAGDYMEGYQYELIDGKLYVSAKPEVPENWVEMWLSGKVNQYARDHQDVINYLSHKARVFVPEARRVTAPEPDLSAYQNFPFHRPIRSLRWQDVSPMLVSEVLAIDDPYKDLVRNVELYLQVPSIEEYWLLDTREDPERPTMRVHRRQEQRWHLTELTYGETYRTDLLPGFELLIDPRA